MALELPKKILRSHQAQLAEDRRSEQGAWVFIASLTVFFIACIVLYAVYVFLRIRPAAGEIVPFYLPRGFLFTTVTMVAISILLHLAVGAARREKQVDLARYLYLAFAVSILFFILQGTSLSWMIDQMMKPTSATQNLYGLTFFLVVVHALHVVGGVAALNMLLFGLARQAYDHERNFPIRFCALYWHFLDVVWILMLFSFGLAAFLSKAS